ncbi:unnamed protein product, partial [Tetraodon nigroviridis]
MGSKLSRQRSLDLESKLSRRRSRNESPAESEGGGREFLFTSLMLRSDTLPGMLRRSNHSPYVRRVAWIREIQTLLREHKTDQAAEVLRLLRKHQEVARWTKEPETQETQSKRKWSAVDQLHDLGLQGTSLNDILYKNASFLNLVDPISHELLLSLARDLQCPKREKDAIKSSNKTCRQLIYHLTPHSKWTKQGVSRRKSQAWKRRSCRRAATMRRQNSVRILISTAPGSRDLDQEGARRLRCRQPSVVWIKEGRLLICSGPCMRHSLTRLPGPLLPTASCPEVETPELNVLCLIWSVLKTTLKKKLSGDVVNLSGIPLSGRDVHRVAFYLQSSSEAVSAVDLSFTELQDDGLRLLLPPLSCLPKLTVLAINGNRLTRAILKDLTDTLKDPSKFPCLAWVDLGNNVDIFTVPQPLLVALRRRFGLRSSLPVIYEY